MKSLILVVCVLVLSACQSDNSVGSGPLTLAPDVQTGFEKYMNGDYQIIFVVTTDGRTYYYYSCPDPHGACSNTASVTSRALENCQKNSGGVPCKIYAKGRNIVWEGAIHGIASKPENNVLEPRLQQARTVNERNDKTICARALSVNHERPSWDNKTIWREYVNEAKRRDLAPQSCAKLLGWKVELFEKDTPPRQIDSGSYALRRPIAVQWDGFDGPIAGYAQITGDGKLEKIKLTLPGSLGECTGKAEYKKRNSGLWFIKCGNGKSASGAFLAHGSGKGSSGDGYDNNGHKVKFTISGE